MKLQLRRATQDDAANVHAWRNQAAVRAVSLCSDEIPWDAHVTWFSGVLANPQRDLLMAEQDGVPVGVLRLDVCGEEAEVSLFLAPGRAGQGLGTEMLRAAAVWAGEHRPEVKKLRAQVKPDNTASLRAFDKAGYAESHRVLTCDLSSENKEIA